MYIERILIQIISLMLNFQSIVVLSWPLGSYHEQIWNYTIYQEMLAQLFDNLYLRAWNSENDIQTLIQ